MQKRLQELESEKDISARPPVIVSGAVIIPRRLLDKLMRKSSGMISADAAARRKIEMAAIKAVTDIETSLGYIPRDVSAEKRGYDIESLIPEALRGGASPLRFIEVKGRKKGADTVTITKNEMLAALNTPDEYMLAIVEVDGATAKTVYLKKPFHERPDFAATSVNYNIEGLMSGAEIVLIRHS
jgi:hypothetical protein